MLLHWHTYDKHKPLPLHFLENTDNWLKKANQLNEGLNRSWKNVFFLFWGRVLPKFVNNPLKWAELYLHHLQCDC